MTVKVPTEVPELLYPSIEAATEQLEDKATQTPADWDALQIDRQMQSEFLQHFAASFNITLSLARSGAKAHQLMRWRTTELNFVRQYNDIHNEWKSRLITSAMTRAVGYLSPCDPRNPTTSGFREDAAGTPIYEGADSRLTLRMLEAHFPETYSQNINLSNQTNTSGLSLIPDDATGEEAADAYALVVGQQ
jgi:hypothetical protein